MTIEQLFGSKLRAKLLGWFFTHVDERFFVRQLHSLLAEDPTNLSRELARLEGLKILTSEAEGRQKYFKVNKHVPFYEEMKGLILKTTGVTGAIRSSLGKIRGVKFAFLYGSFAKNQEKPESDVDLMVVGKVNFDELEEGISESEKQLGRTINITSYSLKEFYEKTRAKDGFIQTVLKGPKIMLIGDENEFKRS
jgi:predicted nucleotidyltransferase